MDAGFNYEQTKKIEKLVASIAHEIKNPLAGISSTVQILSSKLPPEDHRRNCIDIILEEVSRLEGILDRFLMLARPRKLTKNPLDVNEIIEKVITLEQKNYDRKKVQMNFYPAPIPDKILGDAEQIQQVILNLLINSRNALKAGGVVDIKVESYPEHVKIIVIDNGPGVSPRSTQEIFEPFYSTTRKGVGLGLAISRRIMREHGGDLVYESPKQGAVFVMNLPRNQV